MQRGHASSADPESGALTYQVYAPEALPPARPMNLSRMSFPDVAPKPNIAARVGLALVAACVVVGTAVLVIVGTADEPRAKTAAVTAPAAANANANATGDTTGAASALAPVASAPPIAEPPPVAADPPPPVADPPPPAPVAAKAKGSKAKGASSAGGLRGVAVPPNPFGGGAGAPAAKPAKKK